MDANEYLEQIEVLSLKIKQRQIELLELKSNIGIGGLNYAEKVMTSGNKDHITDAVIDSMEIEQSIKKDIKRMNLKRNMIIGQIHKLKKKKHIKVLFKKYVEFKDFSQIGKEMSITPEYAKKLNRAALREFEKLSLFYPSKT